MTGTVLVVTPARNESRNVAELYRRLAAALDGGGIAWRWLLVDDCSGDDTFAKVEAIARADSRVGAIRLTRHNGSHGAIMTGLLVAAASPDIGAVVVLASDLQDPPEALPDLIACARQGAEIVFAQRGARPGVGLLRRSAALAVHSVVRLLLPASRYPWRGTDAALFGRRAIEALAADSRPVANVFVRAARLGLQANSLTIRKDRRRSGNSQWLPSALRAFAFATIGEALGRAPLAAVPRTGESAGWISDLRFSQTR